MVRHDECNDSDMAPLAGASMIKRLLIRLLLASQMAVGVLGAHAAEITAAGFSACLDRSDEAVISDSSAPVASLPDQIKTEKAANVRPRMAKPLPQPRLRMIAMIPDQCIHESGGVASPFNATVLDAGQVITDRVAAKALQADAAMAKRAKPELSS